MHSHSVRGRISLDRTPLPYESYVTRHIGCINRNFMRLHSYFCPKRRDSTQSSLFNRRHPNDTQPREIHALLSPRRTIQFFGGLQLAFSRSFASHRPACAGRKRHDRFPPIGITVKVSLAVLRTEWSKWVGPWPGLAQLNPRAVLLADAAPNCAALIQVTTFAPMTDKAE